MTTDNIVMWVTQLISADWAYFKTQILLDEINIRRSVSYLRKPPNICPHQLDVQETTEIISLDAGLRMDGLLGLDLWDVLRSTNNTKRPSRLAPGNWCGTGNHSSNKTKTKTPTERNKRDDDQVSNLDYVPTNTHSSQGASQLHIFEDNEAVIKMIIKGRCPTMRHMSRTHRVALAWLFDRINLEPKIQI